MKSHVNLHLQIFKLFFTVKPSRVRCGSISGFLVENVGSTSRLMSSSLMIISRGDAGGWRSHTYTNSPKENLISWNIYRVVVRARRGKKEAKISKLYWLIINHYRSARPGDDVNGMTYGGCCFFGIFFALCGARFFGQIISGWNGFVADLRGHSSLASMRRQQRGGNSDLWLY